jgi:hypothetical protein
VIRSLERSLEVDHALSERQIRRHHGLTLEDCRKAGLTITEAFIAPSARSSRRCAVNFVSLEGLKLEGFEWRHLAGIAEMRHVLQAEARDWRVLGHAAHTSPDAIWTRGLEVWAIEYDAGAYTLKTVARKARAFDAGFDGQIWGVPSRERAKTIESVLPQQPLIVYPF